MMPGDNDERPTWLKAALAHDSAVAPSQPASLHAMGRHYRMRQRLRIIVPARRQ